MVRLVGVPYVFLGVYTLTWRVWEERAMVMNVRLPSLLYNFHQKYDITQIESNLKDLFIVFH
jgi:hypothetical protein